MHAFALTLLLSLASSASAQVAEPERLTSRGRIMIAGALGGYGSNDEAGAPFQPYDKWRVYAHPSATLFIQDHIGIGASLGFAVSRQQGMGDSLLWEYTVYEASLGVHAILELPLARRLGWVVLPMLSYSRLRRKSETSSSDGPSNTSAPGRNIQSQTVLAHAAELDVTAKLVRMSLSLPLLIHVSDSVGIGFGPDAWIDVFVDRGTATSSPATRLQLGASTWLAASF